MKVRVKPQKIIDREAKRAGIFEPLREHLERVIGADTLTAAHIILEFGSGRNGFIEYYTGEHQTGLALDLVDNTGCYDKRIKCLVSDGRTIPLDDASVDLIVSRSVVEHVGNLPHSLGEMNRVLRPAVTSTSRCRRSITPPLDHIEKIGGHGRFWTRTAHII